MRAVHLVAFEIVIRIIEGFSVRLERLGAKNGVVHHALHAIAIARIASDAQEVASQLEVRVGAAGRLKAAVSVGEAGGNVRAAWSAQNFVRSPAAGGEALRGE